MRRAVRFPDQRPDRSIAGATSVAGSAAIAPRMLSTVIPMTAASIKTTIGLANPIKVAWTLFVVALALPVAVVALLSGFGFIALPFEMFELDLAAPVIFRVHMITGGLTLMLAPFVIAMRHRPQWHRMLGRVLGAFVMVSGITALLVAVVSTSSFAARAGFFTQGVVWMALLGGGIVAIRQHDRARHQALMLMMVAVTTGAVWFRLITGTAIALRLPNFDLVYALAAWLGWMLPLTLVCFSPFLRGEGAPKGRMRGSSESDVATA
jgi:hypothetical protein